MLYMLSLLMKIVTPVNLQDKDTSSSWRFSSWDMDHIHKYYKEKASIILFPFVIYYVYLIYNLDISFLSCFIKFSCRLSKLFFSWLGPTIEVHYLFIQKKSSIICMHLNWNFIDGILCKLTFSFLLSTVTVRWCCS